MKNNFLKFLTIIPLSFLFTACNNDDDQNNQEVVINYSELSESCKNVIETHFPDVTVTRVEKKNVPDTDGTVYEVKLSNGMEIDFTAECDWTDIDGNNQQIPYALVPETILTYVQTNYPSTFIEGIDKEPFGYEVELSNNLDLIFNSNGEFVRIDD